MKIKADPKWIIRITLISVAASVTFTFASTEILGRAGLVVALVVLAIFIALGILFDIIGVAVAAALEAPFNSMSAHRVRGAAEALKLIKSAEKVTSFCNDVVGDVSGIVSGSTAALFASRLTREGLYGILLPLLISGIVTGLTIGGKAVGKAYAISSSTAIVLKVGKLITIFKKRGS